MEDLSQPTWASKIWATIFCRKWQNFDKTLELCIALWLDALSKENTQTLQYLTNVTCGLFVLFSLKVLHCMHRLYLPMSPTLPVNNRKVLIGVVGNYCVYMCMESLIFGEQSKHRTIHNYLRYNFKVYYCNVNPLQIPLIYLYNLWIIPLFPLPD